MIGKRIFHWAETTPARAAVIYNGTAISYRRFADAIELARGYFASRGSSGPGYALLAVDNRLDFWIASLALRSLGLSTLVIPTNEALPALPLPNIRCIVTSRHETPPERAARYQGHGIPVLSLSLKDERAGERRPSGAWALAGGHVLRTSGTTGEQKLVLMDDALDALFLERQRQVLDLDPTVVLCVFDFPPWTAVGYRWAAAPWAVGGTTVIEQRRACHLALTVPGLTHAILVPNLLAQVLAAPRGAFPFRDTLRLIVCGGALTGDQLERARSRITPQIYNWLASTEAGGIAFTALKDGEDQRWHRPIPGRIVEVVGDDDRPLPPGVIGRVRIGVAGGPERYLDDDEATGVFFRDGYFYPGDLALRREDGRLALEGRLTDVINIAGNKISPAAIELRLAERLALSGICLFSKQNQKGEEEIHAVIEAPGVSVPAGLAEALTQELPGFTVAHVHFFATLPRNSLGKLMRQEVYRLCRDA